MQPVTSLLWHGSSHHKNQIWYPCMRRTWLCGAWFYGAIQAGWTGGVWNQSNDKGLTSCEICLTPSPRHDLHGIIEDFSLEPSGWWHNMTSSWGLSSWEFQTTTYEEISGCPQSWWFYMTSPLDFSAGFNMGGKSATDHEALIHHDQFHMGHWPNLSWRVFAMANKKSLCAYITTMSEVKNGGEAEHLSNLFPSCLLWMLDKMLRISLWVFSYSLFG